MRETPFVLIRPGAALACCLAAFVLLAPRAAPAATAGFSTSRHDFTTAGSYPIDPLPPTGSCSVCHVAHKASPRGKIWARSLEGEFGYYNQGQTGDPNYVPGATLQCYDCHNSEVSYEAVDPATSVWNSSHQPQDIAQAGAQVGYYETACGQRPGTGNTAPVDGSPTGGHYWKSVPGQLPLYKKGDKIVCSLCHDPHNTATGTNEAFFRTTTWDGSTMKALNDFNAYGTDLKASTYNATTLPNGSRNGTGTGRAMCAICHGYSDVGNQATLYSVIVPKPPEPVVGSLVPVKVPEHASADATPCISCHGHNQIAGCNECHGYPPLLTATEGGGAFDRTHATRKYVQNYSGGAGAHRRHLEALGPDIFKCEICHGPNPGRPGTTWHNQTSGDTCNTVTQANVDIIGQTAYWGADGGYVGASAGAVSPVPSGYSFAARGGNDGGVGGRCTNLTCHGNPPTSAGTVFLNWSDKMVDDSTGNPVGDGLSICKWCHDKTPARIGTGPWAPNVLGNSDGAAGDWTTGNTWGADVNGHGLATGSKYDQNSVGESPAGGNSGAGKSCTLCHDARYTNLALPSANTPIKPHFNATSTVKNRIKGSINGVATADADAACNACHQVTPGAGESGTQVSTHGNDFAETAEPPRAATTRACRQCHDVHGANWNGLNAAAPDLGRNLYMVGKWVDANGNGLADNAANEAARVDSNAGSSTADITSADLPVVFTRLGTPTTPSADDSFDDGFNDTRHESVCVVCHTSAGMNPSHKNSSADAFVQNTVESTTLQTFGHNPVGTDCLLCHNHDYDKNPSTADAFAPSGCFACHGTKDDAEATTSGGIKGQFWPDGNPSLHASQPQYDYADNQPGAHLKHVESIAQQVYGETAALVVVDSLVTGLAVDKQKTICVFCHPDPGGAGHSTNVNNDPQDVRVNVYRGTAAGDWLRKYTPNAGPAPPANRATYADDTTAPPNGYNYTTASCANLVCHNQVATPAATAWDLTPGWNVPPTWTPANAACSNIACHVPTTYTNAHAKHVNGSTNQKSYACTECHSNNTTLGHGNGEVDMVFNVTAGITPPPIEAARGGNGFYDKDNNTLAVPVSGDTAFGYKTGSFARTCNLVYCHGGDNAAWGGGDITPVWDDSEALPLGVYCGSCHDGNGTVDPAGDASVTATGNHTDHLSAAWGPNWGNGGCTGTLTTGCHTAFDVPTITPTHVNGSVDFDNIAAAPASSPLGTSAVDPATATDTDRCTHCHSAATVTVFDATGAVVGPLTGTLPTSGTVLVKTKANWDNTVYELPCLTCHNGTDAGTNFADGTGRAAPNMLGTDLAGQSGAEIRGHGLTTGNYPVAVGLTAPNPAANKYCTVCHDKTVAHLNGSNDTTFTPGNRMLTVIDGFTLPASTTTAVCESCHARVGSSATKKNVNMHSNNGYALPTATTQGRLEAVFTVPECMQCHDPHGMTANGTGYNIYMVPGTITVVPGASPVTVPNVRFEALKGDNSFNDTLGTNVDLCVVCHVNSANPGNPMKNTGGDGQHGNIVPASTFYDADERGRNCSGCHTHNRDNLTGNLPANMDGFMPVACNSCHTYPGLASLGAPTHLNSTTHDIHAGDPVAGTINNYAFRCRTCHYGNDHNQMGMNVGDTWSHTNSSINIRFDPARNGGSPTYAGANAASASAPGADGAGVCALLYCHGDGTNGTNGGNVAFPAGFKNATIVPPHWNVAAEGNCGTCHKIAGSATPVGTLAHPKHAGPVASGQYAIGCQVCHYGTTTDGASVVIPASPATTLHVNGSVEVSFNAAADARLTATSAYNGDTTIGSGYGDCTATYCHSPGTVTVAPYTQAPAAALGWNQSGTCGSCHGNGPAYADGSPKANKHDKHVIVSGYGCQACHYPTTTTGTTVTTLANHVNRVYDVSDDPANAGTLGDFTYTAAGATCISNCHGGHTAGLLLPAWSTTPPIVCNDCHGYIGGGVVAADVNNFSWDGATQSKVAAAEYTVYGHGAKGAPAVTCARCHDSNAPHDQAMSGANPFRLGMSYADTNTFCSNTTTCHTGAQSSIVVSHTAALMTADQRTWPTWIPKCVDCHDPHGDNANLAMIQADLFDRGSSTHGIPTATLDGIARTTDTTVFTTRGGIGTGSYADSAAPASGICQECHLTSDGLTTNMLSFLDDNTTPLAGDHPSAGINPCTSCHIHNKAFEPAACEGCHDATPYVKGSATAPNVMGDGILVAGDPGHTTPRPYDDGTYGYNVSGHGRDDSTSAISKGDPIAVECTSCHSIGDPPGTHPDGVLNGRLTPSDTRNANSFHLLPGFINTSPGSDWAVQMTFDDYCWTACHSTKTSNMRHPLDGGNDTSTPPPAPPYYVVTAPNAAQFGTHSSKDAPTVTLPTQMFYDRNLVNATTLGSYDGIPNFALCVSCHNPHGTKIFNPRGGSATSPKADGNNRMMIYWWEDPGVICVRCH